MQVVDMAFSKDRRTGFEAKRDEPEVIAGVGDAGVGDWCSSRKRFRD